MMFVIVQQEVADYVPSQFWQVQQKQTDQVHLHASNRWVNSLLPDANDDNFSDYMRQRNPEIDHGPLRHLGDAGVTISVIPMRPEDDYEEQQVTQHHQVDQAPLRIANYLLLADLPWKHFLEDCFSVYLILNDTGCEASRRAGHFHSLGEEVSVSHPSNWHGRRFSPLESI